MKNLTFNFIRLRLWERKGFFQQLKTTETFNYWLEKERVLLNILVILAKKNRLPKNIEILNKHMATSHRNNKEAFSNRSTISNVLNIQDVLEQLI